MIKKLFHQYEFFKNILTLISGNTVAQLIPIMISPILTRIYSPEEYGVYSLYLSVVAILAVLSTMRLDQAILLPKKNEDAFNIVALSIFVTLVVTIVSLLFILFFFNDLVNILGTEEDVSWLFFIPVSVLFSGLFQTASCWSNRKTRYSELSTSKVSQSITTAGTNLFFGKLGFGSIGLTLGNVFGLLTATLVLVTGLVKKDWHYVKYIKRTAIIENFRRYADFPKYSLPRNFLDEFRNNSLVYLINLYFGSTALGNYHLGFRTVQLPLTIIGSSISQVFYQKISSQKNAGESVWNLTRKMIFVLFAISFPIFLLLFLAAPMLFEFIFGNQWKTAGEFSQLLVPWLYLNFITTAVSTIPLVFNKQKKFLVFGICYNLLLPVIFMLTTFFTENLKIALLALSLTGTAFLFTLLLWMMKLVKAG